MNLIRKIRDEPLAAIAIILTIILAVLQSDWFAKLLSKNVKIIAFHKLMDNGRCPLVALSIDNPSDKTHTDISLFVIEDWITKRGDEELIFYNRDQALIGPGELTPVAFREATDVNFIAQGSTIQVPKMLAGEYLDLFVARTIKSEMNNARDKLGAETQTKFKPYIDHATSQDGVITVEYSGPCRPEFDKYAS